MGPEGSGEHEEQRRPNGVPNVQVLDQEDTTSDVRRCIPLGRIFGKKQKKTVSLSNKGAAKEEGTNTLSESTLNLTTSVSLIW